MQYGAQVTCSSKAHGATKMCKTALVASPLHWAPLERGLRGQPRLGLLVRAPWQKPSGQLTSAHPARA